MFSVNSPQFRRHLRNLAALIFTISAVTVLSDEKAPFFPGTNYDAGVPTMNQVVGYGFGEKISMHYEALAYAKALANASPLVSIQVRGKSWEDREMALLFITSEENQGRLDTLKKNYQALADPRRTSGDALESLVSDLPVLVWLQQSVHGDEISGVDSGLMLAWHMAAAQGNAEIDRLLKESLLVIELTQNPDGRDRFVTYTRQTRSPLGPDADPQAAEHIQNWPAGRFNHYFFDMNRDWFAMTQPETRAKVASLLEWFPHVTVDLHEMGGESSFFAAKPSPPANPLLSQAMLDQYEAFGKAIGRAFDARGFTYFHSEIFDSFYPGYGESWPSLQGSIGVLFEQASARGLTYRRRDGSLLTYRLAITQQAVASYAMLQHAVENRIDVLNFYHNNRAEAINGDMDEKDALLLPGDDPARAIRLARLLRDQGIELTRLNEPVRGVNVKVASEGEAKRQEIPAGTIVVPFRQPAGRLARTLLLDNLRMDPEFLEKQEARREARKRLEIYDITGWSLPLLHGVSARYTTGGGLRQSGSPDLSIDFQVTNPNARLAFLFPRNISTGAVLSDLLQRGLHVYVNTEPIVHEGVDYPRGSLIVKRERNPENLGSILSEVAKTHEASVTGVNSGWFESGPSLGSNSIRYVKPPRVAILWGRPCNPMSAGWARYVIEQKLGYPVTVLRTDSLGFYRLDSYDVILMPEGSSGGWASVLGEGGTQKIKSWVREGGVLITLSGTTEWLIREEVGLLQTSRELRGGKLPEEAEKGPPAEEESPMEMIIPKREFPQSVAGVLLRVAFDNEHWASYGMLPEQAVLVDSNRILRPLRLDQGANPGRFTGEENLLLSGYIDSETLGQFAHKPYLMVRRSGRGIVVAFTEDPNYRAFMDGLQPLLANAIFLGPANAR